MKINFSLFLLFSLRDGKKIRYEEEWNYEFDIENGWIDVRVSPIEMANEENPESLTRLLIDHIVKGAIMKFKPILDEESQIIQDIKTIHSMNEIATITLASVLEEGKDHRLEQRFEYDADSKIMKGFSKGVAFLSYQELCDDPDLSLDGYLNFFSFTEAHDLNLPRYKQEDGTHFAVFYNETDEEKNQRLWNEFNAKMELFEKEYGNAKDAYLANLKHFPIYPDVERAKQIINYDIKVDFRNKYILICGCPESSALINEIERRGGIYKSNAAKRIDYYILWDPDNLDGRHYSSIKSMLNFRDYGGEAVFVTAYQLWKALKYDFAPLSSDEIEIVYYEREEKQILSEIDKLRTMIDKQKEAIEKKKKKEEEKLKQKAEKEEIQRKEKERKKKEKAEKERKRLLVSKAEHERKDEILKRKAAKQEEKRISQEIAEKVREDKKKALEEARANAAILYAPGQEPEKIKKRIETLLEKLDNAYPDHSIVGLGKEHKKWGETITELYRLLGYADNRSFLEAYGFTIKNDTGGRPTTLDPDSIIDELKKRYPNGIGLMTMSKLKKENPDLKIKTLENNALSLFGETLAIHLLKCLGKDKNDQT